MKKTLLLALSILLLVPYSYAGSLRDKKEQGLKLDGHGGISLSTVSHSVDNKSEMASFIIGPKIGLGASYAFIKKLSVKAEVNYVQHGFSDSYNIWLHAESGRTTNRIHNVEVPVLLSWRNQVNDNVSVHFAGGAFFAYNFKANTITSFKNEQKNNMNYDTYKLGNISHTNYGLAFDFSLMYQKTFVGIRYNYGLSNMSDDSKSNLKIKTHVIDFCVGYRFK